MTHSFQKRFLGMLGTTFLVIILGLITLSIQSQPSQIQPTPQPPTYTPEPTPALDTSVGRAVLDALFPYLKESAYHAEGGSSWLLEAAVSGGIFTTTQMSLASGLDVTLDTLQAYVVMRPGKVLEVPVIIGIQAPGQPYTYFSDTFFYQNLYENPSPDYPTRDVALADASSRLPRGRVFLLIAEGGVSADNLEWQTCSAYMRDFRHFPTEICQIGAILEWTHPGQLASFIQKSAYSFPASWQLAGWFFQELDPQVNSDIQTDVTLPPIP